MSVESLIRAGKARAGVSVAACSEQVAERMSLAGRSTDKAAVRAVLITCLQGGLLESPHQQEIFIQIAGFLGINPEDATQALEGRLTEEEITGRHLLAARYSAELLEAYRKKYRTERPGLEEWVCATVTFALVGGERTEYGVENMDERTARRIFGRLTYEVMMPPEIYISNILSEGKSFSVSTSGRFQSNISGVTLYEPGAHEFLCNWLDPIRLQIVETFYGL